MRTGGKQHRIPRRCAPAGGITHTAAPGYTGDAGGPLTMRTLPQLPTTHSDKGWRQWGQRCMAGCSSAPIKHRARLNSRGAISLGHHKAPRTLWGQVGGRTLNMRKGHSRGAMMSVGTPPGHREGPSWRANTPTGFTRKVHDTRMHYCDTALGPVPSPSHALQELQGGGLMRPATRTCAGGAAAPPCHPKHVVWVPYHAGQKAAHTA